MSKLKICLFGIPLLLLSSCGNNGSSSKYGNNKFITEGGTTYGNARNSYNVSMVMLKADGTGSATRNYNGTYNYWEFNYKIDKEVELYFPWFTGDTLHYTFSVNEDGKRQMEYLGNILTEFYGGGYLS